VVLDKDASRVRAQKNGYLARRRLVRPYTTRRMVFFNLDRLQEGDSAVTEDCSRNQYEYEVSEVFVMEPDTDWMIDHMRDRDMVTAADLYLPKRREPYNRPGVPCLDLRPEEELVQPQAAPCGLLLLRRPLTLSVSSEAVSGAPRSSRDDVDGSLVMCWAS
jgi:hypothetical protein